MQVLEDQQQGLHLTFAQQHALERGQRALAALRRVQLQKGAVLRQHVQQRQQRWKGVLEHLVQRQNLSGDLGTYGAGVVAVLHMAITLEQVEHREVGGGFAVGHRGALQHQPALGAVRVDTFVDQARLAHARLPHQGHHLALPRRGLFQRLMQRRQFLLPPHKAGEATRHCGLQAPAGATGPQQLEHLHRLRHPLHRHRSQGVHLHQAFYQAQGGGGKADGPGCGQLFHARCQVGGLPHGRIVHVQVVANSTHHHLSGVQADADLQLQAVRAAHLLAVWAQRRLHGQGGVAGACGVIFMGNGGTKQGHKAVAEHLVHRALEAVHGVHHAVDGRVEELLGGFRVEALDKLGGVFDVGKQHRDLFALAFQGGAGGQNLLRQVGRGVGERRWFGLQRGWGRRGVSRPDQHFAIFVAGQALGVDELGLEILEVLVVERKASFERPIGHASLVPEEVEDLG